jgi:hypothetical protein
MRDDQVDTVWIHYDAIHPSHKMRLENGSLIRGVWSGTWRCERCRSADFRGRDGQRTAQAKLNEPCADAVEQAKALQSSSKEIKS